MKARVKGTDEPFRDIETVEMKGVCGIYFAKDVEFEPTPDHWQDVRERAAIAAMPQCIEIVKEVLFRGGKIEKNVAAQVASICADYADALVEKLKGE